MQRKVKLGVLGAGRGVALANYCKNADNAQLVAVCENYEPLLNNAKKLYGADVKFFTDFDEFIKYDMDAVILANFANEHAPFAIKCFEHGKHVLSEVLPVQCMKEAVELVEAAEKYSLVYAFAENCCFLPSTLEMKKLYEEGKLGEFEYGEGEYLHNCENDWHNITAGNPNHWRNTMYSTFYCTHSIGPLLHITGLKPVKVTGLETAFNARMGRMGAKSSPIGIEMITLDNGSVIKSLHGVGPSKSSLWFSVYGTKGRAESARESTGESEECTAKIFVNVNENEEDCAYTSNELCYSPENELTEKAKNYGHGGADYYILYNFCNKLLGDETADVIGIYEALDMFLPGLFAYRSILQGGIPLEIPDLRNKETREKYRNDTLCTDPKVAGDMLVPSLSTGNPDIPQSVYDEIKKKSEISFMEREVKRPQLLMRRFGGEIKSYSLPEGYTVKYYSDESEIKEWVRICENGLVAADDMESFKNTILGHDDIVPEKDVIFIISKDGEYCASITTRHFDEDNAGGLHMVSVRTDFRGLGLSNCLCEIALKNIEDKNYRYVQLTTDDFRKAAVKSYVTAGFLPVIDTADMRERWQALVTELNIDSLDAVDDDGNVIFTLVK